MSTVNARPAVVTETSLDESFLLGTKDQLKELAHTILRIMDGQLKDSVWDGIIVQHPTECRTLTEPLAEVAIDGITIVKSEDDRRSLLNYFRTLNGELPIDWIKHDELHQGT